MTQQIRVAKSGKNVLTATDPNDFIFHSSYNTFKILAEGTLLAQTVDSDPKTFTVAHGLGFAPNFYAFCKFPDGKVALAGPLSFPYDRDSTQTFTPEVDATNFYFIFDRPGSNYNVDIKWYAFEVAL